VNDGVERIWREAVVFCSKMSSHMDGETGKPCEICRTGQLLSGQRFELWTSCAIELVRIFTFD